MVAFGFTVYNDRSNIVGWKFEPSKKMSMNVCWFEGKNQGVTSKKILQNLEVKPLITSLLGNKWKRF